MSPSYPLGKIITMAGGCDFLKCDCEGAEWQIIPEDLEGVRRIEMELHIPPICGPPNPALLDYISRHYHFGIERRPVHSALGVMGILHAGSKDYYLVSFLVLRILSERTQKIPMEKDSRSRDE
jgi:hypothetical protein